MTSSCWGVEAERLEVEGQNILYLYSPRPGIQVKPFQNNGDPQKPKRLFEQLCVDSIVRLGEP